MESEHHLFKIAGAALVLSPHHGFNCCSNGSLSWSCSIGPYTSIKPQRSSSLAYSFSLVLPDGSRGLPLDARFKFSLLDRDGLPVPSRAQASSFQNWLTYDSWVWSCDDFITSDDLRRPEYLDGDDCFTVRCDVALKKRATSSLADQVHDVSTTAAGDLHEHLGKLLTEEQGADVTFQAACGETFAAHRCVLAARSPVFRAQLFGEMKEGMKQSCTGGTAVQPIPVDMEAQVFRSMLRFIYTDSLPLETTDDDDDWVVLQYHLHLLAAADRYGLERLKLVCQEKLRHHIRASSVATLLASGERYHCRGLKDACFDFLISSSANLESFTETDGFDLLLSTCPAVLKELLARLATTVPP